LIIIVVEAEKSGGEGIAGRRYLKFDFMWGKIKQAYYYLFYRLYLFGEAPPSNGNSDWTASGFMAILETFAYFSFVFYYKEFFNKDFKLGTYSPYFLIPMGLILVTKYFSFFRNDTWLEYYEKFDNWPLEKNKTAGTITLIVVLVILLNFALAMYLFVKNS
jgi:hypothetical protein